MHHKNEIWWQIGGARALTKHQTECQLPRLVTRSHGTSVGQSHGRHPGHPTKTGAQGHPGMEFPQPCGVPYGVGRVLPPRIHWRSKEHCFEAVHEDLGMTLGCSSIVEGYSVQ